MVDDKSLAALLRQVRAVDQAQGLALLRMAVQEQGDDPRPQLLLAGNYAQARQWDNAEAVYADLLQRYPDYPIARFQLGLLQFTSGRAATALVTWRNLDGLAADDPLRLFKTGFTFLARDAFEQAVACFREGMAHNTANPPLNADIALVIERILSVAPNADAARDASGKTASDLPPTEPESHVLVQGYRRLH
jgi:tetratricopeptide (TPR) repeat protein